MRMHMHRARRLQPLQHTACLGQVDQVVGPCPVSPPAQAQGQPKACEKAPGLVAQHLQRGLQQRFNAALQYVLCLALLAHILVVLQFGIPATQGNALNLEALALQREDFTANETVADLGVLIDEISNAHRNPSPYPRDE